MRYAEILSQSATRTSQQHAARAHAAHCHIHRARVSRRQFIQSAAGLTAFAATLGSSVSGAQVRSEDQVSVLSHRFPQHSPSPVTTSTCRRRPSREPIPIRPASTNFHGTRPASRSSAGSCEPDGSPDRRDAARCRMLFNDMRFMQGRLRGPGRSRIRDRAIRVHLNRRLRAPVRGPRHRRSTTSIPGITRRAGLFWTERRRPGRACARRPQTAGTARATQVRRAAP